MLKLKPVAHIVCLFVFLCIMLGAMSTLAAPAAKAAAADSKQELSIDWFAEIVKGGMTSLALILLSAAAVGFAAERLFFLRKKFINPDGYLELFRDVLISGDGQKLLDEEAAHPSILGKIGEYVARHPDYDDERMANAVGDIAARELERHTQRAYPLAIIATMAPMLGLLGTMIGMIEAFQKVAVLGDTGDASVLADSIGKALITTAVGLILAIPALGVYHFLKQKVTLSGLKLEEEMEKLLAMRRGEAVELPSDRVAVNAAAVAEAIPVSDDQNAAE